MEWNGMVWYGMEWNGMEWNGRRWKGMEGHEMCCTALYSAALHKEQGVDDR